MPPARKRAGSPGPSDASTSRDFLLHAANRRTANDLNARAAAASRLMEAVASPENLATALLNVVHNKGAPSVDRLSVDEVLAPPGHFCRVCAVRCWTRRTSRVTSRDNGWHADVYRWGTPQGGLLSPLLYNVLLDEFDKELARRRLRFVRYAHDCNIFVRSARAGQRVMGSIREFLQSRLRLQANDEKSTGTRPD